MTTKKHGVKQKKGAMPITVPEHPNSAKIPLTAGIFHEFGIRSCAP